MPMLKPGVFLAAGDAKNIQDVGIFFRNIHQQQRALELLPAHQLRPAEQRLEADEIIELLPMAFDAALEGVRGGEIQDAKTAMALRRCSAGSRHPTRTASR